MPEITSLVRLVAAALTPALVVGCGRATGSEAVGGVADPAVADRLPTLAAAPPLAYPDSLRRAGIEGEVVLEVVVDSSGHPERQSIRIVSADHPGFVAPAREAVLQSIFRPPLSRCRAVRMGVRLSVGFGVADSSAAPVPDSSASPVAKLPMVGVAAQSGEAFHESAVEQRPEVVSSPRPRYPSSLRRRGTQGDVMLRVIVDTAGRPEPESIRVVCSTHAGFETPARETLAGAVFRPARLRGRTVRVEVWIPVIFRLTGP